MLMSDLSKADAFAEAFRSLCLKHKQDAVALVYVDPHSNDKRLVVGPQATSQWLTDAAAAVISKSVERRKRGM